MFLQNMEMGGKKWLPQRGWWGPQAHRKPLKTKFFFKKIYIYPLTVSNC